MIDPGASVQVSGNSRLLVLPSVGSDSGNPWQLAPGRMLVARVIEAQAGEAVLAWGRHRLPVRAEPPLNPGSTIVLQVHEASGQRVALRMLGTTEQAGSLARAHPYAEFLLVLGLADEPRNRAIMQALMRGGQAVTTEEMHAVRQAMARVSAADDDAQAVVWLRQSGLPLNRLTLELARSLVQAEPTTASLWEQLWQRLAGRAAHNSSAREFAAQLPLVQLAGKPPTQLAPMLQEAVRSLAIPLEARLAERDQADPTHRDARSLLNRMQGWLGAGDPEDPLDETIAQLKLRVEAQQMANAVRDGPLRIDLPLLVDGRLERATLLVHWQEHEPSRQDQGEAESTPRLHAELEVELGDLGPVQVELLARDGVLWCWIASDHEATRRMLSSRAAQLAEGLELATGLPTRIHWLDAIRRHRPAWAAPLDVRT